MNILDLDQNLLLAINSMLVGKSVFGDFLIKLGSVYLVYALPLILIYLWYAFKQEREKIFLSFCGTILAWLVITKLIIPSIWFRPRPNLIELGANELLFRRPDYSFPSDHATALFGIAFGLYIFGFKKVANWMLIFAIVITVCRVAIGVHFPLDIIGGAISGLLGVLIVFIFRKKVTEYIYKPILKFLKKVRLA